MYKSFGHSSARGGSELRSVCGKRSPGHAEDFGKPGYDGMRLLGKKRLIQQCPRAEKIRTACRSVALNGGCSPSVDNEGVLRGGEYILGSKEEVSVFWELKGSGEHVKL